LTVIVMAMARLLVRRVSHGTVVSAIA